MNNLLKEKSKFTYSLKVKTAQIHQDLCVKMPFCQKVVILTKIRPKIRLFWKKSLISDHGLLKRTIVGALQLTFPASQKSKDLNKVLLLLLDLGFGPLISWNWHLMVNMGLGMDSRTVCLPSTGEIARLLIGRACWFWNHIGPISAAAVRPLA